MSTIEQATIKRLTTKIVRLKIEREKLLGELAWYKRLVGNIKPNISKELSDALRAELMLAQGEYARDTLPNKTHK